MGKVIGIDLGTTNSCIAVMEGGNPIVIPNAEGMRTTPSVVAITDKGERLVGETARRQAAVNVEKTISSIKRKMGSDYRKDIGGKSYSPQEISAIILQKLKKDAESYLGETVSEAVITVPAYFTDSQRQATKDAGRIAGLNVLRIINEPTAAAFAYGLDHGHSQKILVYDLGGGTFDISLIEIGDQLIEVLATAGDNKLGGDDFDERLANYILSEFKKKEKIDLSKDRVAYERIMEEAEKAKKLLSSQLSVNINIPFISNKKGEPKHIDMDISRAVFESLIVDIIARTEAPVRQVLKDASVLPVELNMVLLVGGSTRIPAVQEMVKKISGKEPSKSMNPDECVAIGAAIQGAKLGGEIMLGNASEMVLMDVTPLSLSIETIGGVATKIIDRNTTIPTRHSQVFTTAGNFQTSVDIKVLQGERQFARDNSLLGNFKLKGIKRALAGIPQIEVTFDIDVNGIVNVSAKDLGTGKEQSITITSGSNLSEEEINKAMEDAKIYASKDNAIKNSMDLFNEAEMTIYNTKQRISKEKKTLTKEKIHQLKEEVSVLSKMINKKKPESLTESDCDDLRIEIDKINSI